MTRQRKQERTFCKQVMKRLPARTVRKIKERESPKPWSFLFPAGIVLTGAFAQSAALVALILSALVVSGIPAGISSKIGQVLSGWIQTPGSALAQYTWIGQLAYRLMNQVGISGAQVSEWGTTALSVMLPATVFLLFTITIFLALSGWAGWELSRKRIHT